MHLLLKQLLAVSFIILFASCNSHYPEGMSRTERKKYYHDYNKEYEEKKLAASAVESDLPAPASRVITEPKAAITSVPFSIRNNSPWPQKIEIAGNILDFAPLGVRYVGFAAGTKAYLYDKNTKDGRGEFLFEVKEQNRDGKVKLFH